MNIDKQVEIIEKQLGAFDDMMDKLRYLNDFFKPDPDYTKEAITIVMGNLCREMK